LSCPFPWSEGNNDAHVRNRVAAALHLSGGQFRGNTVHRSDAAAVSEPAEFGERDLYADPFEPSQFGASNRPYGGLLQATSQRIGR
jgi:hypothetical protein